MYLCFNTTHSCDLSNDPFEMAGNIRQCGNDRTNGQECSFMQKCALCEWTCLKKWNLRKEKFSKHCNQAAVGCAGEKKKEKKERKSDPWRPHCTTHRT